MADIALKTTVSAAVSRDEAREVLGSALQHEAKLADARRAHFERLCHEFEAEHHITSDQFMEQFEAGTLGDDTFYFDWYAAKRGLDLRKRR